MLSKSLISGYLAVLSFLCLLPALAQQKFSVGERVDADVTHLGIWKPGVVTEVLQFDRYRVLLDEDKGRYDPTVCLLQYMRKGSSQQPAQTAGTAKAPAAGVVPQPRVQNSVAPAQAPKQNTAAPVATAQKQSGDYENGIGRPPNGRYECNRIGAGGFGGLAGGLEIRGGSYRGFGDEGAFAPLKMNGNNIVFGSGLAGIPDSWVIKHAAFVGNASFGKPTIKIWFTSGHGSGFNHCIDCYKAN